MSTAILIDEYFNSSEFKKINQVHSSCWQAEYYLGCSSALMCSSIQTLKNGGASYYKQWSLAGHGRLLQLVAS